MNAFLAAGTIFALFAILVYRHLVHVPPGYAYVVERLGRYVATLNAGWSILMPFADRVAFRIPLAGETIDLSEPVAAVLEVRVVDPRKACYEVADYRQAAAATASRVAAEALAERGAPVSIFDRQDLAAHVQTRLADPLRDWGLEVLRVEVRTS